MIQIVKSFRVGVWGRPFFKRVSPSESKQSRSTLIELTLKIKDAEKSGVQILFSFPLYFVFL